MMESLEDVKRKHEVLEEVVAYVEVRSKNENRSKEVAIELEKLGACISFKLNNKVTHVVFKDGTRRTWNRAKKLGIPLVSVLWVDSCKRSLQHAEEEAFFVSTPHNVTEAEIISIFPKKQAKGFRSMQPKNLSEEFEDSAQRCYRRRKRSHKMSNQQNSSLNDVYFTPVSDFKQNVPRLATPPSMKEKLLEYNRSLDNTPISHRSFQKQIFNDGSDVENSSPSEDKEMLKTECFKPFSSDGSTKQDSLSSECYLSINNQTPHVPITSSDLVCLTNQLDILNDIKQNPKAVSEIRQLEQNAKISVSPDSPMKLSIYNSIMSSSFDVKSVENSSTDSDVPEDDTVDVGSTVFKDSNIFSKSPVRNLTSSLLSSDCDTSLTAYKRSQRVSRQKFNHRETMHVLGIYDEDHISSKPTSLSNANIPCHRTDDVGSNISSFTLRQEEVLLNGNSQNINTQSVWSWKSVASVDSSQASKAWEMVSQQKEAEREKKQVAESQQTTSSCLSQLDTLILDDETLEPKAKRKKLSVSPITRNLRPVKKSLVMTSMSTSDQEMVKSVAKILGECVISDCVKKFTTHVICDKPRRTLNVLFALSQGCWLVSKEWVSASMEAGYWVDEKKFELVASYPVAQLYREQKQFNSGPKVFHECGNIYVSAVKAPPKKDLIQLLQLCGGKVKNTICNASIYVGEEYHPSIVSVTPLWVFDSISSGKALPFYDYMLGQPKPPSPEY